MYLFEQYGIDIGYVVIGLPTGEASTEPNQKRASPKGPALFLFLSITAESTQPPKAPRPSRFAPRRRNRPLTLSRPLRCRKLSAGKCTHPLTPALLSARAAPGRGPYPNHSTSLTPGTEAPGAAGRQPAQAPLFLFWGPALPVVPWPVGWPGRGKRHTTAPAKMQG